MIILPEVTADGNQKSTSSFDKADYYLAKKQLFDAKKSKKALQRHGAEWAQFLWDGSGDLRAYVRQYRAVHLAEVNERIREARAAVAAAKGALAGDPDLFDWSERRKETLRLADVLRRYDTGRTVQVGGRTRAASEYAHDMAFRLRQCSTILIRQENQATGDSQLRYREKCGSRWCPLCGHFHARKVAKQITNELTDRIRNLPDPALRRGRLVHMVLTTRNVELDRVLAIKKAWRRIQHDKSRVYKTKKNPHAVWNHLPFGLWKFEVTQNPSTRLWHPHLHVMAWADGWLAPERRRTMGRITSPRRVIARISEDLRARMARGRGWWYEMQRSWQIACAKDGLFAARNGSTAAGGAKVQHLQAVLWFSGRDLAGQLAQLPQTMASSVSEIAKYVSKSASFGDENPDDLVDLMATLHGRQLMSGWGGVRLSLDEEDKPAPAAEEQGDDQLIEAVYRFDPTSGRYRRTAVFPWNEAVFAAFLRDLATIRNKSAILNGYELSWRQKEGAG